MKGTKHLVLFLLSFMLLSTAQGQLIRSLDRQTAMTNTLEDRPFSNWRLNPQQDEQDVEKPGNPKGMYAGMFFGTSQLNYSFDGSAVSISEMDFGGAYADSVVTLSDGVATVSPDSKDQRMNLDAGFWLGYFPGFLTFDLGEEKTLAVGAMTQLGLSFNGGFGGWVGIGPEVMFAAGRLSVNMGYSIGYTGTQRKLGALQLDGVSDIVIESNFDNNCTPEDFANEGSMCRLHNSDSEFYVIADAFTQSFYSRIGYSFGAEKKNGIAFVIGHRQERSSNVRYELWGPHEKIANEHRSTLNGQEMKSLQNGFNFTGLFFQIEFFTRPF